MNCFNFVKEPSTLLDTVVLVPEPKKATKAKTVLPAVTLVANVTAPPVAENCWPILWTITFCKPSDVEPPWTGFQTGCDPPEVPGVYATSKLPLESTMVSSSVKTAACDSATALRLFSVMVWVVNADATNPGAVELFDEFVKPVTLKYRPTTADVNVPDDV